MSKLKRDANRWRFTQRKGYFECGPWDTDGDFTGYSVGIQKKGMSVNASIRGTGNTLKKAIDEALKKETDNGNDQA